MSGIGQGQRDLFRTGGAEHAQVLSVSQLTSLISGALKRSLPAQVSVRAEVSNCKFHAPSGHTYFTLKDQRDCIDCVLYKSDAARLNVRLADGMELIAIGPVIVYGPRGRYQMQVRSVELSGQGALELAFRRLKATLEAEGLFSHERKKPLPRYPTRIALVTSRQAAGYFDMLKVLRATPFIRLLLFHVPVQGQGAAGQIAAALDDLNAHAQDVGGVDLILLGRGGGSLEDLWAFNEEVVARAVGRSRIPIVTGIGHEVDVSIADLAADYHAHTPTKAAEVAIQNWRRAIDEIEYSRTRLRTATRNLLLDARQRLEGIERHELFRRPMDQVESRRQLLDDRRRDLSLAASRRLSGVNKRLDQLAMRLAERHPRHRLHRQSDRLSSLAQRLRRIGPARLERLQERVEMFNRQLEALGPGKVLSRGYTLTLDRHGRLIRSARQVGTGDRLVTRFADGEVESSVRDTRQGELFE